MTTLNTVIVTAPANLPAGLAPGSYEVTLSIAGSPDVVHRGPDLTASFPNLTPGDYTVTAVRLAATGERISTPVTATINVPVPPPVMVDVPHTITLTLA